MKKIFIILALFSFCFASSIFAEMPYLINRIKIFQHTELARQLTYSYNESGKILYAIEGKLDDGEWKETIRLAYSYDDKGNILEKAVQLPRSGNWETTARNIYTYNDSNKVVSDIHQIWDNGLINSERHTYKYDENQNLIESIRENWEDSVWVFNVRHSYTFDSSNFQIVHNLEQYDGDNWVPNSRYSSTYTADGNLSLFLYEQKINQVWQKNAREKYSYDEFGKLTEILTEANYSTEENWRNSGKIIYHYNDSLWLEQEIEQQWQGSHWANYWRKTYAYDENGYRTEFAEEIFNSDKWNKTYRRLSEFDKDGHLVSYMFQRGVGDEWAESNSDGAHRFHDSIGNEFMVQYYSRIEIEWDFINSADEHYLADLLSASSAPNPFHNFTTIKITVDEAQKLECEIIDHTGRIVRKFIRFVDTGTHFIHFHPENLPSGSYFYNIRSDKSHNSGKLIYLR